MDKQAARLWMEGWTQLPDGTWHLSDAYCIYEANRYGLTPDEIRSLVMARQAVSHAEFDRQPGDPE